MSCPIHSGSEDQSPRDWLTLRAVYSGGYNSSGVSLTTWSNIGRFLVQIVCQWQKQDRELFDGGRSQVESGEHHDHHKPRVAGIWLWLKKPVPKWNPGNWKRGPKPAVCPSCLILSHTHLVLVSKLTILQRAIKLKVNKNPRVYCGWTKSCTTSLK